MQKPHRPRHSRNPFAQAEEEHCWVESLMELAFPPYHFFEDDEGGPDWEWEAARLCRKLKIPVKKKESVQIYPPPTYPDLTKIAVHLHAIRDLMSGLWIETCYLHGNRQISLEISCQPCQDRCSMEGEDKWYLPIEISCDDAKKAIRHGLAWVCDCGWEKKYDDLTAQEIFPTMEQLLILANPDWVSACPNQRSGVR